MLGLTSKLRLWRPVMPDRNDRSEIKLFLSITIVFTLVSPDRALRSVPS